MMKCGILTVAFCLLALATSKIWNKRFQTEPDRAHVSLYDSQGGPLRIERKMGEAAIARSIDLPIGGPVDFLHIKFSFRAVNLVGSAEKWEGGRLMVDWYGRDGHLVAHDTLVSLEGYDENTQSTEMVVPSKISELYPSLRVEHLGLSGAMEIHDLQAYAVRERGGFQWFVFGLLILWSVWIYGFVGLLAKVCCFRKVLGSMMLLGMGWLLAVPGPWAYPRAIGGSFDTGLLPDEQVTVIFSPLDKKIANSLEPLGEMPVQGSWLVKVKIALSFLRPVLHVLLFAAPAFAMAMCCGPRCSWWSISMIAILVEVAQFGFGFGSDWIDLFDLLIDWLGIGAALWLYKKCADKITPHPRLQILKRMFFPATQTS